MTNRELVLNMLAEVSTKDISEETDPETFSDHMDVPAGVEMSPEPPANNWKKSLVTPSFLQITQNRLPIQICLNWIFQKTKSIYRE